MDNIIETPLKRSEIELIMNLVNSEIEKCQLYNYEPNPQLYEIRDHLKYILNMNIKFG